MIRMRAKAKAKRAERHTPATPSKSELLRLGLYTLTAFASAALLFVVQPMIGKMILPRFGGSPAVWNTCMVFFQAALLAGYAYAHASTTWFGARRQAVLQVVIFPLALLVLPFTAFPSWGPSIEAHPLPALLAVLLVTVGAPFFLVSTTAPLLQRWFAATRDRRAGDPYFLYAASNVGSLLALVAYPFLIEPRLSLREQATVWAWCYAFLCVMLLVCGVAVWRTPPGERKPDGRGSSNSPGTPEAPVGAWRRLRWVALAFVPSSLMLGTTTYLTTDVGAIPMVWIVALALYLASFVLVFSRYRAPLERPMRVFVPAVLLLQVFFFVADPDRPLWASADASLLALFGVAMVCHGELARDRPSPQRLTEYYLLMSVGGVLGGAFNALAAPVLFPGVVEYPLALVLACLLMRPLAPPRDSRRAVVLDLLLPAILALVVAAVLSQVGPGLRIEVFGLLVLPGLFFLQRPVRMGLGLAALLGGSYWFQDHQAQTVYQERNFYGVLRVVSKGSRHTLFHGSTQHGAEDRREAQGGRSLPLLYYYPTGPLGQVFKAVDPQRIERVAVVGLGSGAIAWYGRPGQEFVFFEIDPSVVRLATDPRYFTYLEESPASKHVVVGDARLSLARQPDHSYDLLILDAFSGDAIPAHLLTRQAMELYLKKLREGGVLALHISNKYLDLEPVVERLAAATDLAGRTLADEASPEEQERGKASSHWVVLARREKELGSLASAKSGWYRLIGRPGASVWTDDYSDLVAALRW